MQTKKIAKISLLVLITSMLVLATYHVEPVKATTNYNVYLNFHKALTAKTICNVSTTQIMNTTGTGYWGAGTELEIECADNATYYNSTFYLYPALAGALTINKWYFNVTVKSNVTTSTYSTIRCELYNATTNAAETEIASASYQNLNITSTYEYWRTGQASITAVTIPAGQTIYARLCFISNTTDGAVAKFTLKYDTAVTAGRIELGVVDHFAGTIATYKVATATTDFSYLDTINGSVTITDKFGGYDIKTVAVWYVPEATSVVLPTGTGSASLYSGSATSYTVYYSYSYAPTGPDYLSTRWTPKALLTDNYGNQITVTGSYIGITGPGGGGDNNGGSGGFTDTVTDFFNYLAESVGIPLDMFLIIVVITIFLVVTAISVVAYAMSKSKKS